MRAAVVGTGLRGRLFATLMDRHADTEIVGGYDPSEGAQEAFTNDVAAPTFPTLPALLAEAPEVVVVATPDHHHLDATLAALESGARVLLEKPLATSTDHAVQIRDCARNHGDRLTVACLNRWHPAFAHVLDKAKAGDLGTVLFQNARLSNSIRVPLSLLSWAGDTSPGWFLMPHSLDLVAAMAPAGRTVVTASGHRGVLAARGVDTWDGLQAMIGFADGSSALVESLWTLPEHYPSPVRFGFEVVGERATAVVEDSWQGLAFYGEEASYPRVLVGDVNGLPSGPNTLMIDAFLDSARRDVGLLPDAQHGMWVTQLIEAIHLSAENREPVVIEPH